MTTSQANFEAISKSYASIFLALEKTLEHFGIDFYLIGAQSSHLTQEQDFIQDPDHPYRFHLGGQLLDLIPFGGMEKNGEVVLENPLTELSVYGCREVTEDAVVISGKFKVISLPGLCIMKLIAFDEKPDLRFRDFQDFTLVMKNYGEIAGEELFSSPFEDLVQGDFELSIAAARMLGRNMQSILSKNEILRNQIKAILKNQLQEFSTQEIDQMYLVNEKDDQIVFQLKLIAEVLRGIAD